MKKQNRVGEIHMSKNYGDVEIIEYFNNRNCTIKFLEDGTIVYKKEYARIVEGQVRNPNKPSVCGIGYIGVGKYNPKDYKIAHVKWNSMFERAYSYNNHINSRSYITCSVCEEWHNFQNFAPCFEENWKPWMNKAWALDKDVLFKGNKIYSPETCCLLPPEINSSFVGLVKKDRKYPLGVHFCNLRKKFVTQISNWNKNFLGFSDTPEEAFYIYKPIKEIQLKIIADKWRPFIEEKAYKAISNYQVEIKD